MYMVATRLPADLQTLGCVVKRSNSTFAEHGHIAYQIKRNEKCSNMQAHIMSLHTPLTPEKGSKVQKHIFCPYTHPPPEDGVKRSNFFP